jgi:hypothetical protein
MFVKIVTLVLLVSPFAFAFRTPDNVPKNMKLPTLKARSAEALLPVPKVTKRIAIQYVVGKPHLANRRQKWRTENTHENEYWHDERIHSLGNVGFGGAVHAALAPLSTKVIDVLAYNGTDIRQLVSDYFGNKRTVRSSNASAFF